jgi:diacylglycerol O-acyltransferase / wax synthase
MSDTLTALDATFLELEQLDDGAMMSIGGAMVFDLPPNGEIPELSTVREETEHRLVQLPRYFQRLSAERVGGLSWPRWVDHEAFDIAEHVRHASLPAPGGEAELCGLVAELFSRPLDRSRPLWEVVLVDGLEHDRWALLQKTHHCLVDGVGSVDVLQVLLDAEPHPRPSRPATPPPATGSNHVWDPLLARAPDPLVQASAAGAGAVRAGFHAALHPAEAFARSRGLAGLLVRDEIIGAPHTSLNVRIGRSREFAVVRASLAELKTIGHTLGGSVNDVALAACTSGLRALLSARGESLPARGLRAMVPTSLRAASEHLALGNRVSSLFVELPIAEPMAIARFERIAETTKRLKSSSAAAGADTFVGLAGLAPPVLHAALARSSYATRLFNVTITNVPGPQLPLFAFGGRLREVQPFVPLAAEHAVGIAVFSYDGAVTFGISADRDSTPDLDTLVLGIAEGIDELLELTRTNPAIEAK